jgi:pimeloyl-ACP methyl ester carboxylesterase
MRPILILSGDHDISFPVEDWCELSRELPTVQHVVFSRSGHGPQHQFPEASAELGRGYSGASTARTSIRSSTPLKSPGFRV